jgi:hypothetical protein
VTEELTCRFCENGMYHEVVNPKRDPHALHNQGFGGLGRPDGRGWRILECDRCGHIQLFRLSIEESERRGWRP